MPNTLCIIIIIQASLSQKYKVDGIPTLVFVNAANGELITKDGRAVVMEDTNGENFPWKPQTFEQIISSCKFVNKEGKEIAWGDCKNGTVGVYFSAHWVRQYRSITQTSLSLSLLVWALQVFYSDTC